MIQSSERKKRLRFLRRILSDSEKAGRHVLVLHVFIYILFYYFVFGGLEGAEILGF